MILFFAQIYEGERGIASKNNKLGELHVEGLTPGMAGTVWTDYTFKLDTNGILHVTATHQVSGIYLSISTLLLFIYIAHIR